MHDDQDERGSGFNRHRAQCVPSLLARLIDAFGVNEAALVFKDQRREVKADVVFAPVLAVFPLVPFVAHLYIQSVLLNLIRMKNRRSFDFRSG